jgi:hypothetical protein
MHWKFPDEVCARYLILLCYKLLIQSVINISKIVYEFEFSESKGANPNDTVE